MATAFMRTLYAEVGLEEEPNGVLIGYSPIYTADLPAVGEN